MEAAIVDARRKTLEEVEAWGASLSLAGGNMNARNSASNSEGGGANNVDGGGGDFPGFPCGAAGGGAAESASSPMCITPTSATRRAVGAPVAAAAAAALPPLLPQQLNFPTATPAAPSDVAASLEARILAKIAAVSCRLIPDIHPS